MPVQSVRVMLRRMVQCATAAALVGPSTLAAQTVVARNAKASAWHDIAADSLIDRATQRRSLQLADSTLLSYRADAHGFLAFLGQLGEGVIIPPKVIQSEELALSISWWQPNRSAQQLVGRRDTTLLPAEVGYYRDRYGVILDNLPDRIRLGDGQDVRDVPHPLAASARALYEFQRVTPLQIHIPGRDIIVDEVRFRPRDGSQPAAIGSVFLDRETAAVVRISMTFTRAALLDKRIETLVVTLENGLVRERYWLPRRQEVEVSRGSTIFDIPTRGIVRGRWEVSNYDVNEKIPATTLALPRWSSKPADSLKAYPFTGRVVDVLPPEIQIANSEDVSRVRELAEISIRSAMLSRPARTSASGRGMSDVARFNRVEGLSVGAGLSQHWGAGWVASVRARFGIDDRELKGRVSVGRAPPFGREPLMQLFAERDYRDVMPAERGGLTNSLGALLLGSDYTLLVDTRAAGIEVRRSALDPFTLRVAYETDAPLVEINAKPLSGSFGPVLGAWSLRGVRAAVRGSGGWVPQSTGATRGVWTLDASVGAYSGRDSTRAYILLPVGPDIHPLVVRANALLRLEKSLSGDRALMSLSSGAFAFGRDLAPQHLVFAGGPWSAPGYAYGQFATRAFASQRFEFHQPVPFFSIPLGSYGKAPAHVTLAPFVQAIATASGLRYYSSPASGVYPSVGVGALFFFDLLRFDAARGLRDGTWRFAIDIDRGFWGVM